MAYPLFSHAKTTGKAEDDGEVERLEQHPLVHGPVAEERDRDPILSPDP